MSEWKETGIGKLPSHWTVSQISEVLDINGRIGWRGYKTSDLRDSGPVVVGGVNIKSKLYLDFSILTHLSREKFEESPDIKLKKGDVILVSRGNGIGDVGWFNGEFEEATINPSVVILTKFQGNSKFLFYYLSSPQGQYEILSHEGGSSIPALYQNQLKKVLMPLPPPEEQKAITAVLASLDDKIDLLHCQNKTLEALAQTLFRHWFIDEADDDWEENPVSHFGDVICGKTPTKKKPEYFDGDIPFIKIPDMHGRTFVFRTADTLTELGKKSQVKKSIPPRSISVSCIATVGLVTMNAFESQTNQQINTIVPSKDYYRYFLYLTMVNLKNELILMASGGTATLNLNTGNFSKIEIVSPPEDRLQKFHSQVEPMFEKIFKNQEQIQTLEKLRDTLLPKLMSGEVRVRL